MIVLPSKRPAPADRKLSKIVQPPAADHSSAAAPALVSQERRAREDEFFASEAPSRAAKTDISSAPDEKDSNDDTDSVAAAGSEANENSEGDDEEVGSRTSETEENDDDDEETRPRVGAAVRQARQSLRVRKRVSSNDESTKDGIGEAATAEPVHDDDEAAEAGERAVFGDAQSIKESGLLSARLTRHLRGRRAARHMFDLLGGVGLHGVT